MSSGGGYVDVTSKPVTPLFSQIKRFRAKVESGDPPLGPLISSPDARVTDAIGDSADFIWIDNEHTPMSYEALSAHIFAAHNRGVAVLVRVQGPNNSAAGGATGNWGWSIKAALDSGADGVIVPQVRTADEVRSVVADCRYPTGPKRAAPFDTQMTGPSSAIAYPKRGMGHMIASNYFREEFYHYLEEADRSIYVVMQLETKEAVENIEEICAVPGLDSIVFGQMDLSGSLGYPHCATWAEIEEAPGMLAAMERACAACKATGTHCGVSTGCKVTAGEVMKMVDNKGWDKEFAETRANITPILVKPRL